MIYTPRLTRPIKSNKYYITKAAGGYSNAIKGKCKSTGKPDTQCDTLSNCVGYAYGRFHEIAGDKTMSYTCPVNAENFPEYAKNCKQGSVPKLGAIIVWQKGATLKGSDGAGHVAIVEEIISDTQIRISQSGYNSNPFWTEIVTFKNGNWTCSWMGSSYKFRCFIYNPKVTDDMKSVLKKGSTGIHVKEMQQRLNNLFNYELVIDGSFGDASLKAVKDFQSKRKITCDGVFGEMSWKELEKAEAEYKKPDGVVDLTFIIDNKEVTAWATNIKDQNYIRMADLDKIGLAKSVQWDNIKKKVNIKTK